MRKLTTDEFIKRSNDVHNQKYDYTLTEYSSGKDKITIICKEHGEFLQRASAHLEGQPIEYFGGLESFEYQIIRDKIKNEYCLNNNIHLLIIKYNDNILEKLSTLLDIHHFLKQD